MLFYNQTCYFHSFLLWLNPYSFMLDMKSLVCMQMNSGESLKYLIQTFS